MDDDVRGAGFKERTRLADARRRLLEAAAPHERTERITLGSADGRVVAESVRAPVPVPSYDRAAMDGYAVRAEDTFGASQRSPSILRAGSEAVGPGDAVRVHTGSELPEGADAVVMVEQTETVGEDVEVFDAVAAGENVGPVGEDVSEGQTLFDSGHRLRPSDLGVLKSVELDHVEVYQRPTAGVVPTGEELVQSDPDPGEIVETNGLTVSQYVSRWGGEPTYRNVVTDDREALRVAIQRDLAKDVVVTTGGSSVGERDLLPSVVADLGEVLVHGVALKPGHPVALGLVEGTPVVMLPGYPVACIVNAVQFLRPLLKRVGHMSDRPHPTVSARLDRKIPSEPGTRTFARVTLSEGPADSGAVTGDDATGGEHDAVDRGGEARAAVGRVDETSGDAGGATPTLTATPTRTSGAGVLSSVSLADGWVAVPEDREGIAAGETVAVEDWEWSA